MLRNSQIKDLKISIKVINNVNIVVINLIVIGYKFYNTIIFYYWIFVRMSYGYHNKYILNIKSLIPPLSYLKILFKSIIHYSKTTVHKRR